MKKLAIVFSTVLALVACNKTPDPAVSVNPDTVKVEYTGTDGTVSVELKANRPWKLTRDEQTWYSVEPLEGTGDATLYIRVDALEEVAARAAELTIQAETATAKLSIVQGLPEVEDVKSGSFVIEEVFFTGVQQENGSSDADDGDQYIRITNNTDKILYADGLYICLSSEHSQNGGSSYWEIDDDLSKDILVRDMFKIPGTGEEVPVLPGHSLIIAIAAQDFAAENGVGLDLSAADFEIYDGENVDQDNPDVPNLENFIKSSLTITILNNRGHQSYALVKFPEDVTEETFKAEKAFTGTRTFWMDGAILGKANRPYPAGSYLVPNAWVVDGINCGVEEEFGRPAFNVTIDAGYTGCGSVKNDPNRYGKSALRKSAGGKLVDSNNSTNDFTRDAAPTLKK